MELGAIFVVPIHVWMVSYVFVPMEMLYILRGLIVDESNHLGNWKVLNALVLQIIGSIINYEEMRQISHYLGILHRYWFVAIMVMVWMLKVSLFWFILSEAIGSNLGSKECDHAEVDAYIGSKTEQNSVTALITPCLNFLLLETESIIQDAREDDDINGCLPCSSLMSRKLLLEGESERQTVPESLTLEALFSEKMVLPMHGIRRKHILEATGEYAASSCSV
ncbi:hypothetical protein RIF29_34269 [Crotalaria pallida]|uniref:Uncharacterized protein n=1 Tax=Crotalaria pallida TaxID=3830 RepID=A0AAN9HUK5_CROPI